MSTHMQEVQVGDNRLVAVSPAPAIGAQLAAVLATAALSLAIAGIVYGPQFMTKESRAAPQTETTIVLAAVGAALRDQSPQCLLQEC